MKAVMSKHKVLEEKAVKDQIDAIVDKLWKLTGNE
jgi:hypothetical protein